jgi:cytochrome c biogenesis factor
MKIAVTFVLVVVAILALFLLLMAVLGISIGVRVSGNLFADEGLGSVSPVYLALLVLVAAGGMYLLWRDGRRAG